MLNKIFSVTLQETYIGNNNTNKKIEWNTGYHWDQDYYFIKENDVKRLHKILNAIDNHKPSKINPGDNIYASKISEIPRFKLKEFIKENHLKKVSRKTTAQHIIINKGYYNELLKDIVDVKDYTFIKGDFVKKEILGKNRNEETREIEKQKYNEAENKDIVCYYRFMQNLPSIFVKYPNEKNKFEDNTHNVVGVLLSLYRQSRHLELLNILLENEKEILNGNVQIIYDEVLFEELNKDGIELDDEYLAILRDMLFSKDENNVKLGFEMMSNLVINQPTLLSLAFLLNELYNEHNFRPSKYTQSNSNLKSLLKIYRTRKIYWESNWKAFGTGLRVNFKEGKEGEIVKKFLLDNINREFKLSNSASESLVDIVFSTEGSELSLLYK
jgi:hypothetical protein